MMQVLSRRTKNNPVLIGEPGVGKTAIVEGIAQRIVQRRRAGVAQGQAPALARPGGAGRRRQVPRRVRGAAQGRAQGDRDRRAAAIILFIDELHTLVGAGAAEGAMDASNMLKPALARGELRCIGATTLDEYRKRIEKDAALERRFQPVFVGQPTVEDTIAILRGLKERYEVHHGIRIQDAALVAAATLADRYITDRFLPDKAIDLVDEAAASSRWRSTPCRGRSTRSSALMQLQIEQQALQKERDTASKARLAELKRELAELERAERDGMRAQWLREKELIGEIREVAARASRSCASSGERASAAATSARPPRSSTARSPSSRSEHREDARASSRQRAGEGELPQGRGHRRGHRGDRLQVDRHPRPQDARGRDAEAAAAWRSACATRVVGQEETR